MTDDSDVFENKVMMLLSIAVALISAQIGLFAEFVMEPSLNATALAIAALGVSVYMIGISFLEFADMGGFKAIKQALAGLFRGETA